MDPTTGSDHLALSLENLQEKKIQATLARIWGEDEATPSVSQPMSEALELDGLTNQAGAASTAPCATSLDS